MSEGIDRREVVVIVGRSVVRLCVDAQFCLFRLWLLAEWVESSRHFFRRDGIFVAIILVVVARDVLGDA